MSSYVLFRYIYSGLLTDHNCVTVEVGGEPLDHLMAGRGYEMVRYADDFVVMCRSE
jgi:hypothetical protein